MKNKSSWLMVCTMCMCLLMCGCLNVQAKKNGEKEVRANVVPEYYVAAYIWPSCHDDPMGHEVLWPEGTGEWEIIKKGNHSVLKDIISRKYLCGDTSWTMILK